jgi:lipoprotein-anchoring transpeptidase ErfK/SrfK
MIKPGVRAIGVAAIAVLWETLPMNATPITQGGITGVQAIGQEGDRLGSQANVVVPAISVPVPVTPYPSAPAVGLPSTAQTTTLILPTELSVALPSAPFPLEDASIPPNPIDEVLRLQIRLSQRQVLLLRGKEIIRTFPIAVGRPGWETPTGTFTVQQMFKDPTWVNPLKPDISIPGGDPENPLGRYWIGFWTDGKNWIGFHGTPTPSSVGRAASHGCIRMYNQDIEELFQIVKLGTQVSVVN